MDTVLVVPLAPKKRVEIKIAEAADGSRHLALKRLPAHLAVGDNFQTNAFLQSYSVVYSAILYLFELRSSDRSGGELLLSFQQFSGTEQAPNYVGMKCSHKIRDYQQGPSGETVGSPLQATTDYKAGA